VILRVTEPKVWEHPVLTGFLAEVCGKLPTRTGAEAYIARICALPDVLVLLGIEDQKPAALLVLEPPSPITLHPVFTLGYNSGTALLGLAMMDQAAVWCGQQGVAFCHMVNGSGRSDAAYERRARAAGWRIENRQTFLTLAVPQGVGNGSALDDGAVGV
jgi:hypothetical protein